MKFFSRLAFRRDPRYHYIKQLLGFEPHNFHLYLVALRHASLLKKGTEKDHQYLSNERLEFLGDSVLNLVIGEYLYDKFPTEGEGFLTKNRSKFVNRQLLNSLAFKMGLHKLIETSEDVGKDAYGNCLEALIGAVFLDAGYEKARQFIIGKIIKDYLDPAAVVNSEHDYKSLAIEKCQKQKCDFQFITTKKGKSGGRESFESILKINNEEVARGTGYSKKEAEQEAARRWLTE